MAKGDVCSRSKGDRQWLEDMLAYCSNIISQLGDLSLDDLHVNSEGLIEYPVTTGPESDPDKYDMWDLLEEIRTRRPTY